MKKISVSLEEQETTINYYPRQEYADWYSSDPVEIRRYKKLAAEYPNDVIIEKEDQVGLFGRVKSNWIGGIRKPRSVSMTPEQKAAAAERARLNFSKQNANAN